ncbi:hypothetical protein PSA5_28315, partial [Pseudomonas syringae pv. actinidiae]
IVESVAGCSWNGWPDDRGIRTFNATKLFEALQYQLIIALDYCYKLRQGQRLWVEVYGDVTIEGDAQVEVKLYKGELTDSHENIWNTLNNWLHVKFDYRAFQRLILMTNQDFSPRSTLAQWNTWSAEERLALLKAIHVGAEDKFAMPSKAAESDEEGSEVAEAEGSAKASKTKAKTPSSSLALQRKVMDPERREQLLDVLGRVEFLTKAATLEERIESFKVEHLKMIRDSKHQVFLDDILGFIGSTKFVTSGWEITCEEFSAKVTELTKRYMKHSKVFPFVDTDALKAKVDLDAIGSMPFVQKMRDINADHKLHKAAFDILVAGAVIDELYADSLAFKSDIERYQEYHHERHLVGRERAIGKCQHVTCPVRLKKDSIDFYLERHDMDVRQLLEFEDTTFDFRNGIYHMLADVVPKDKDDEFLWRLW